MNKIISRILSAVRFADLCVFFNRTVYLHKMPRRDRIPMEHRERIVRAFEDEAKDYLLVADTLGVNLSTARGIVARYIREGRIRERPRSDRNNVFFTFLAQKYFFK